MLSPRILLLVLLLTASLIELPRPLQPISHYLIAFPALVQETFSSKRFCLPHIHVVSDLAAFSFDDFAGNEVRQIA